MRGNGFDQPVSQVVYFPMIALPDAPLEGAAAVPGRHRAFEERQHCARSCRRVKRAITALDVQVPVANERSMEQVVARSMAKRTFTLTLLGIASVMALVLSAIGLYGVVSYVVGERRGEIGIRVALGAQRGEVGRMIVMQSVRLAVIGRRDWRRRRARDDAAPAVAAVRGAADGSRDAGRGRRGPGRAVRGGELGAGAARDAGRSCGGAEIQLDSWNH